jgi:hypothetical protein
MRRLGRTIHVELSPEDYLRGRAAADGVVILRRDEYVSAACLLARPEAFQAVGPLDEAFFLYLEDAEWIWRLHRAGLSVGCVPAARVAHEPGQSSAGGAAAFRRQHPEMFAAAVYYHRKTGGRAAAWAAKGILMLYVCGRIAGAAVARVLARARRGPGIPHWVRVLRTCAQA